jgi:hypothetical protein
MAVTSKKAMAFKQKEREIALASDYNVSADAFVRVPRRLLNDPRIKAIEIAVYTAIRYHAFDNKVSARPSYDTIAKLAGVSRRTVAKVVKRLCDLRYLELHEVSRHDPYIFELLSPQRCTTCTTESNNTELTQGVTTPVSDDNNNIQTCTSCTTGQNHHNSGEQVYKNNNIETCKTRHVSGANDDISDMHDVHPTENNKNKNNINIHSTSTSNNSTSVSISVLETWDRRGGGEMVSPDIFLRLELCYGPQKLEALINEFFDTNSGGQQQDFFYYLLAHSKKDKHVFMRIVDFDHPFTPDEYTQCRNYLNAS